jgi:hypothetical protein
MTIEHKGSMTCNLEFGNVQECCGSKHVGNLVVVDDYSRYTWTKFLKSKNEAFDKFEILSKKIQNQVG